MALLMASSSSLRTFCRSFHSSVFSSSASSVSSMYFLSFLICSSRSLISSFASLLERSRAPPSLLMSLSASLAVSSCSFLDSMSLPWDLPASSSVVFVSSRESSNCLSMPVRSFWILPERASYFILKSALRFSFFQSAFGTSPVSSRCRKAASPGLRKRRPSSTARPRASPRSARASRLPLLSLDPNPSNDALFSPSPFVASSRTSMASFRAPTTFSSSSTAAA
mmetsp:Transcript_113959/g.368223  ORF Transcript_113959/g.368223 Transcript_113959/m.368223 type:complete len:224 (-) Transcript_113959:419-1090(-)